jgi:death on curing protein
MEEYLLIAELILDVDAERLARQADLGALDSALHAPFARWGSADLYPSLHEKAAVLCSRLVRNHPLMDGNKRAAYETMIEFITRNGGEWLVPPPEEAAQQIGALASREISEKAFAAWIADQLA